jgi:putative copper export protein
MTPDLLSVIVRALAFVAVFQAAGAAFFLAMFGHRLARAQIGTRRLALIAAAGGVILLLAHIGLDPARMADGFAGIWDRELQRLAWGSSSGVAQMVQAIGLLIILVTLARPARSSALFPVVGAVVAVAGFLLTGHTSAHALRWLLAPLLALHLLIVAFWFGALVPLAIVSRAETPPNAAQIVERFSVVAGMLVPLIALAGFIMSWILAGTFSVLRKPYGELLTAKFAGFMLLMLLAAYNKWRLTPAMSAGAFGAVASLRRSIAVEYALIVAVLSVAAVLTAFFSPE